MAVIKPNLENGTARVRENTWRVVRQQVARLRFNMVNTVCLGVIHKVPAPGGMSAVGGTGSEYFYYDNGVISADKLGTFEFKAFVQKEKSADGNLHRCATDEGPGKVEAGTHEEKVISCGLEALRKKFVEEDCP